MSNQVIKAPSKVTLAKYGLTESEWLKILADQGNVCAVCGKAPPSGRWVTDHEHIKNWKKLPPEERKKYVRGILDWTCNFYYCGRGITIEKSKGVTRYLEAYAAKRPQ